MEIASLTTPTSLTVLLHHDIVLALLTNDKAMPTNELLEKMCDADLRLTSRLASEVSANLIINQDEYAKE